MKHKNKLILPDRTFVKLFAELRYRQVVAIEGEYYRLRGLYHPVHRTQVERWTNK